MLESLGALCFLKIKKLFLISSYLSIDVVLGATAVGSFFWKISNEPIPFAWFFIFPLAVYGIYNLDHWLDIQTNSELDQNPRRKYHQKHSLFLLLSILISIGTSLFGGLYFFTEEMIFTGLSIGAIAILHFLILNLPFFQNRFYPVKEMTIAIIYTIGTAFPILQPSPLSQMSKIEILLIIFLFSIVWNNLIVNAVSDYEDDKIEGFPSLPIQIGIQKTQWIFALSSLAGIFSAISIFNQDTNLLNLRTYLVFAFALIIPIIQILVYSKMKQNKDLVRMIGELPFILFFLA
ncbi:MAG: UbiA family prenyltransferase [Leptospira sp.]|nr:UbiA family prenyltransferase [Leptospira sp.]NCS92347.1 UbiA family prenyltransferase [Leptospira sp.]